MSESNGNGNGAPTMPSLIPQSHGGALLSGGVPGNAGGGRPPSEVRAACRAAFHDRIPTLETIADDKDASPEVRISAINTFGKYGGLSGSVPIDDVRERLRAQIPVIVQVCALPEFREASPAAQAEMLVRNIRPVWTTP